MKNIYTIFILLSVVASSLMGHEKEIVRVPGLFFTPLPQTLAQEAAFKIVKKLIIDPTYKESVNPDLIPVDLKDTLAVAHLLDCLRKLYAYDQLKDIKHSTLVTIAYNTSYVDSLLNQRAVFENNMRLCLPTERPALEQSMQMIANKLANVQCVKDNLLPILSDERLSYLFLLALNDQQIAQLLFKSQKVVIADTINSFIDLLVYNDKRFVVKKLLSHAELRKIVASRLIQLYLLDDECRTITSCYGTEISDAQFIDTLHELLLDFFKSASSLDFEYSDLGNVLLSTFITNMPSLQDDYKELLNSLIDHIKNPLFIFSRGESAIPYEYWLFEYLHKDPDLFTDKMNEILYFIGKGLTLDALEEPIKPEDNFVMQRAKRNFAQLKLSNPDLIKQFYDAQQQHREQKR